MKAVGLVTFWDNNYGSALQCYALKKIIASFGYRCDLVEEKNEGKTKRYIHVLKKSIKIPCKTLIYPEFGKAYLQLRKHAKLANESLSTKSRQDIHFFGITELQPKKLTKKILKHIGNSDEYVAFITGSDQVWGGDYVEPTYGNFLEFASQNKRISYAASFGSDNVANYNLLKYRKGLRGIEKISVREDRGIELVKELTGKSAVKMPDPTILISVDEWKEFSNDTYQNKEEYVLVHFLDKMSVNAIEVVKMIAQTQKLKIICLGWKRNEILSQDNASFMDGGPREYISLLSQASFVCTDSFHTTLFALRFQKQFYTFPRCYAHKFHQTSRITNLLFEVGYFDRYIKEKINCYEELPHTEIDATIFFDTQRDLGIRFLRNSILENDKTKSVYPNLKSDDECCGCGVCADKCNQSAIQMVFTEKGYSLPKINEKLCISCGVCEKYCRKSILYKKGDKKAYIAYSKDEDLLEHSASGGVFASLAKRFILKGGAVYGAAMNYDDANKHVSHRCAVTINELYHLLQSKYVQSNAIVCFREVEERLLKLQPVLFSGTSCQIDALYRYLGKKYDNLFTIDLVCHGVPGEKFFSDYIKYLEIKNKSVVEDFSFREKRNGKIEYIQRVKYKNGKTIKTRVEKSDYYKLFFSEDSYRQGCYNCEYATINKPADITIGDYFECPKDYPELFQGENDLSKVNGISCCISHNEKGEELLSLYGKDLKFILADIKKIQNSHNNLCYPSNPSNMRGKMLDLYRKGGFKKMHQYNVCMDCFLLIPRYIKRIMKKIM